jgi:hypothetical protein
MIGKKCGNVGWVRGVAWCLVVCLGACGFLRACRGRDLGVAAGPCLRGVLLRVVLGTLVAPLRRWGGALGVAWAVLVLWVGVSALRLWAEWQGHDASTKSVLDTSSVAAASHTGSRGFQCHDSVPTNAHSSSPPSTSSRQTDLRVPRHFHATKRLALAIVQQHSVAPHTPTALNCLLCCCLLRTFLLVLLGHCILPESFCTLQYATQNLHTHSNAVLHRHHTAKKTSMRLPRNSTDIIAMPLPFFPLMRSLSTLHITKLELAGKATCVSLQPGVSSSDSGEASCVRLQPDVSSSDRAHRRLHRAAGEDATTGPLDLHRHIPFSSLILLYFFSPHNTDNGALLARAQ